jgi:hypothetical protein
MITAILFETLEVQSCAKMKCIGPRQGNNAAQSSHSAPMTGGAAESWGSERALAIMIPLWRHRCKTMRLYPWMYEADAAPPIPT